MSITDAQRHKLHTKLDRVLGEEDAAVLISHLPPSGWSDVVRMRDLDQLEARIDAKFAAVDLRFEVLRSEFNASLDRALREQTNRFFLGMGAMLSIFTAVQALLA